MKKNTFILICLILLVLFIFKPKDGINKEAIAQLSEIAKSQVENIEFQIEEDMYAFEYDRCEFYERNETDGELYIYYRIINNNKNITYSYKVITYYNSENNSYQFYDTHPRNRGASLAMLFDSIVNHHQNTRRSHGLEADQGSNEITVNRDYDESNANYHEDKYKIEKGNVKYSIKFEAYQNDLPILYEAVFNVTDQQKCLLKFL